MFQRNKNTRTPIDIPDIRTLKLKKEEWLKENLSDGPSSDLDSRSLSDPSSPYFTFSGVSIWDAGPGRPFDNHYTIVKEEFDEENDTIKFFFKNKQECTIEGPSGIVLIDIRRMTYETKKIIWKLNIERPSGIILTHRRLEIDKAKKITWRMYYDRPLKPDNLGVEEYTLLENSKVHIFEESKHHPRDEIIDVTGKIAFSSR